ncbi:MAG: DNA adenine methylase [Janthinobacterium lividum]
MSRAIQQTTGLLFPTLEPTPTAVTPALKWAGGKRWLLPHLLPLWQPFREHRLVEPFVGGMGVALGLRPERAYLSDINEHLINFHQWTQRGLIASHNFRHAEGDFYEARDQFNNLIRQGQQLGAEAAELFYYLNRTCFNGLCRFNKKNEFNVPFGRYKTINYTQDFRPYQPQLAAWEIAHHDFAQTVVASDDFLYLDPPYDTPFTQYAKEDFTWADQERLVKWLLQYEVPIVATNQATPRVLALYQDAGFRVQTLAAPRRIACTGDRTPALEILATKNF